MIRLSDSQWERIRHHFPEENFCEGRPGRKPVPTRKILEAALWILNTGAQWHMLPQCYPNYKTVHRRFQAWCHSEILRQVLTDIANELRARGVLDQEEKLHRRDLCDGEGWRRGRRPDQVRKRPENHGDRGSPWIAALGQYACCEPSRSALGPIVL
jgi:transposase